MLVHVFSCDPAPATAQENWKPRARSLEARLKGAVEARQRWQLREAELLLKLDEQALHIKGLETGMLESVDALGWELAGRLTSLYDKVRTMQRA